MSYTRTTWVETETALSPSNMNNIEDGIEEALAAAQGNSTMWNYIRNLVYPVGSIYISVNSTNPSSLFGGTWVAWGSGRVPVGVNTSDTSFDTVEETGGSKDAIVPYHTHTASFSVGTANAKDYGGLSTNYKLIHTSATAAAVGTVAVTATGSSVTNANLQPYITCYMWKRTE